MFFTSVWCSLRILELKTEGQTEQRTKKLQKRNQNHVFTITAEMHARSLVNFYCQYADRHMNLKLMPRVSERERAIRQFVIVKKNKLMSVFNVSVLLLTMNFVITLSK